MIVNESNEDKKWKYEPPVAIRLKKESKPTSRRALALREYDFAKFFRELMAFSASFSASWNYANKNQHDPQRVRRRAKMPIHHPRLTSACVVGSNPFNGWYSDSLEGRLLRNRLILFNEGNKANDKFIIKNLHNRFSILQHDIILWSLHHSFSDFAFIFLCPIACSIFTTHH